MQGALRDTLTLAENCPYCTVCCGRSWLNSARLIWHHTQTDFLFINLTYLEILLFFSVPHFENECLVALTVNFETWIKLFESLSTCFWHTFAGVSADSAWQNWCDWGTFAASTLADIFTALPTDLLCDWDQDFVTYTPKHWPGCRSAAY